MDVQFIKYLDLMQFRQVIPLQGSPVPTLDIYGADFTKVSEVFLNNIESPSVVVVSKSRLWAQVPDLLKGSKISDVAVYSNGLTQTERSKLVYTLGGRTSVSGLTKLIQIFVKLLLQSPGQDCFNPEVGGGLLGIIGQPIENGVRNSFQSVLFGKVNNIASHIRQTQQRDGRVPLSERLLAATVQALTYSTETGQAAVKVMIRNEAGNAGYTGLGTEA